MWSGIVPELSWIVTPSLSCSLLAEGASCDKLWWELSWITYLDLTNSQNVKEEWHGCPVTGEHLTHGPSETNSANSCYTLVTIYS